MISYEGPKMGYRAEGHWVKVGPVLVRCCMTKTGARFAAWRLRRRKVGRA
jgi:hypothetical protein